MPYFMNFDHRTRSLTAGLALMWQECPILMEMASATSSLAHASKTPERVLPTPGGLISIVELQVLCSSNSSLRTRKPKAALAIMWLGCQTPMEMVVAIC